MLWKLTGLCKRSGVDTRWRGTGRGGSESSMAWDASRWTRRSQLWRSLRVAHLLLRTLLIIYRERSRVVRARARGEYNPRPDVPALSEVLSQFRKPRLAWGGWLTKLGQSLSARADLLPAEALAELATLQDEVPAEPFEDIRAVLESELRAPLCDLFASVDPVPIGSA